MPLTDHCSRTGDNIFRLEGGLTNLYFLWTGGTILVSRNLGGVTGGLDGNNPRIVLGNWNVQF